MGQGVRKKNLSMVTVALLAVIVLVLAGCGSSTTTTTASNGTSTSGQASSTTSATATSESTTTSDGQAPSGPPVKIGLSTPLSAPGDYRAGQEITKVVELWKKLVESKGGLLGRPIEIVVGDNQDDAAKALTLATKMVTQDKVSVLVGAWASSVSLAQNKVAIQYEVPVIAHFSMADDITKDHSDYVFRLNMTNSQLAEDTFLFLKAKGYKNPLILTDDSAFGLGISEILKNTGIAEGFPISVEVFPSATTDLTPQILKIQKMSPPPDLIIVFSIGQPGYLAPIQMGEQGVSIPLLEYGSQQEFPDWWEVTGKWGVGPMWSTFYSPKDTLTATGEAFKIEFVKEYGTEPTVENLYMYDALLTFAAAVEKAGTDDPKAVASAMKDLDIEGTLARIKFERDATPGSIYWNQVTGQKFSIMRYTAEGQKVSEGEVVYP